MKVLQINSVYDYGSTGKIVKQIHEGILSEGHDSYIIYGRKGAIGDKTNRHEENNIFYINNNIETIYHVFMGVVFDKHGLYSKRNTYRIIKKIDEISPDVIHLHNIHGFYLNYEILFEYLKRTKIPVIWTLHDCWAYTGFCAYYDYHNCSGYKTGCKKCKYRNTYPFKIFNNSYKNFKKKKSSFCEMPNMTLVTPSNWLAKELKKSFLKDYNVKVVHNDVDISDFKFRKDCNLVEIEETKEKRVCLAVSNVWSKQKGYYEYIKLSKILPKNWVLVMIGLNDKQILKLPSNIVGIKRTQSKIELARWYSYADVLINLSLEDNYPTVDIEAMACELPIIGYRTGGIVEQLENKGYLVDKYDLKSVVKLLNEANFAKKTYKFKQEMISGYLELYNNIK